ncbi:MAG TPA: PhoH family protein [Bacteroidales bacterium]|nr:PhoH family protein [Bacteroidales bacterium]HOK99726.1 PhoH family protein [Bacteroidales bacterium]HPO66488.1 PhoH family protein [Bacteroidales bacterium]
MFEKIIYIEGIDPLIIYGVNNTTFDVIKSAFPKLRLVARGNEIKVLGDRSTIEDFEIKLTQIIEYYQRYQSLSREEVAELLIPTGKVQLKSQEYNSDVLIFGNNGKIIKARTKNQQRLIEEAEKNDLLFAVGPAGTGKTYTAIAMAVKALRNKEVRRIILTRPAVEAGEKLGFLPGDVKEKLDPYLQPLYDALNDMMPLKKLNTLIEEGVVQIAPIAFMRGRTLDSAFVILDEAQNATINQLKMFLTRMGRDAKFVVTGDLTQIDLPDPSKSGLVYALQILKNIEGIAIVEFDQSDIIRHRLVKNIVEAFEKAQNSSKHEQ